MAHGVTADAPVEVERHRKPHPLVALRHAPEELRVLAVRVMRALEVMAGSKMVEEAHALVLGDQVL